MRGAPGSGKSTFIEEVIKKNFSEVVVCSADHWFFEVNGGGQEYKFEAPKLWLAHKWCKDKFSAALQNGSRCVVVDNTNIKTVDYRAYVNMAQESNYVVFQAVMTGSFQNVHGVPKDSVERMNRMFQEDPDLPHFAP